MAAKSLEWEAKKIPEKESCPGAERASGESCDLCIRRVQSMRWCADARSIPWRCNLHCEQRSHASVRVLCKRESVMLLSRLTSRADANINTNSLSETFAAGSTHHVSASFAGETTYKISLCFATCITNNEMMKACPR